MAMVEATMARTKGRPRSSVREDVSVKFDKSLAGMARMVATAKGLALAEYLTESARATIEKDFAREMKRLEGGEK